MEAGLNSQVKESPFWIYAGALSVLVSILIGLFLNNLYLSLIPMGVIVLFLLGIDIKYGIYLIVTLFVFSFQATVPGTILSFQIPTEPLIGLLVGLWVLKILVSAQDAPVYDKHAKRIKNSLFAFIGALFLSVITSTMHLVSLKLFINTLFYITAGLFVVQREFKKIEYIKKIIVLLLVVLLFDGIYTLIRHAAHGFETNWASIVTHPFFSEHGSYAAALSIAFSIAFSLSISNSTPIRLRILSQISSAVFFIAIFFSYTRAAWVALVVLFTFFALFRFRIFLSKKIILLLIVSAFAIGYVAMRYHVLQAAERNANSITNVAANYSNLERINRWVAAIDMIRAKPIFGVGYGVYRFLYQKYRNPLFTTPISNMFAGPHNDYLQYFSEAGIFGITTWLLFLFYLYKEALAVYRSISDEFAKSILLGCLGGVLTYNIHAFFNGFLMLDKVAVPFWVSIGIILSVMQYYKTWNDNRKLTETSETS